MDTETFIYRMFTVTFMIVGTITNILSAIIYSKKKMRKTSYSFYLFALALADLCVTLTGNLRLALIYFNNNNSTQNQSNYKHLYDIREKSLLMCRLHIFLTYYFLQLSSIILCLLNLDRFCGCVLILKAKKFCKPSIARRAVAISMLFLFIIDSHFLIAHGDYDIKKNNTNKFKCTVNEANLAYSIFWKGFLYVDGILYCIIPFIVMITCNFMIISKIVRSRIRSKQVVVKKNTIIRNTSTSGMLSNEKRISFILLGISFSFLILTVPVFVIDNMGSLKVKNWNIITAISYMLMYLNHVINFFFYCLLGPRFRREVKELLLCCIPVKTHNKIHHHQHYHHHHQRNNHDETKLNYLKPVLKETTIYLPTRSEVSLKKPSFRERASRLLLHRLNDITSSRSAIILSRQQSFNISNTNLNRLRKSSSVFECSSLLLSSGLALLKTRANTASSIEFNV